MFTNAKIFKYLRFQVKQWDDLHDSSEENLAKKRAMEWEKKITKTLVIVLVLFLACYLPSCVCIYIINFCTDCNCVFIHWVRDIQFVLVMANSGVNPFVYAWRLQNFRKSFKSILTCRACTRRLRSFSLKIQSSTASTDTTSGHHNNQEEISFWTRWPPCIFLSFWPHCPCRSEQEYSFIICLICGQLVSSS